MERQNVKNVQLTGANADHPLLRAVGGHPRSEASHNLTSRNTASIQEITKRTHFKNHLNHLISTTCRFIVLQSTFRISP